MQELNKEEVLSLWKKTNKPTTVYIHSPFCKTQCNYCVYKGSIYNKENYDRYYNDYLPNRIEMYREVLEKGFIKNYFFGGGTPSLMSIDTMKKLFSSLPNLKEKNNVMEFHPAFWEKDQLYLLKEYNFNTVILGIQTFDNNMLIKQNRPVPKKGSIEEFIRISKNLSLNTMTDIIYFDKDLDRLFNDIDRCMDLDVDEISVYVIYKEADKLREETYKKIMEKYFYSFYEILLPDINVKCLRFIKKGKNFNEMFPQIYGIDDLETESLMYNFNVLGIGALNNHKHTFSKIGMDVEYIEKNIDFNSQFLLTFDKKDSKSYNELLLGFLDKIKDIGDVPNGFSFNFTTEIVSTRKDYPDKQTKRELVVEYKYIFQTSEIREYERKLLEVFPEWRSYKCY